MLQHDAAMTKHKGGGGGVDPITSAKSKSAMEAEDARRAAALAEAQHRDEALARLRELSRQSYLDKRETQQVQLLEQELADEERLFGNEQLSRHEEATLRYKKKLLALVKDKQRLAELDQQPHYVVPDAYVEQKERQARDKQQRDLAARFAAPQDAPTETFQRDDEWERTQLRAARVERNKHKGKGEGEGEAEGEALDEFDDNYGFLLDETQIDFVLHTRLEGIQPPPQPDARTVAREAHARQMESLQASRATLPVAAYREALLEAVAAYQVLVVVGETGSGKTTQIPQYLDAAGYTGPGRKLGCTQPRRVAAMAVAARVATEMDVVLGHEVGYAIRFEDCTSANTRLQYMTDGMLIREFLVDPALSSYSVLMVDEAHERSLSTDVLFGLLKDLLRVRPELKLLISSATLDADKFSRFFDDAPIFNIPGRRFPVDIYYTKTPEADYLNAVVLTVMQIHLSQPLPGDILVFLTGQEDIEAVAEALGTVTRALAGSGSKMAELLVTPIYAALPSEMQARIFAQTPKGARKVVLATNIAETSITIDGILFVIDSGLVKQKTYQARSGLESLVVVPCSQAAANQRAGRAGRMAPGKCFRLYTRWSFEHELDLSPVPEIQRTDLASVVLMLKSLGIEDLLHFEFMDAPPADTLIRALELLYALGAVNKAGDLTKLGRRLAELPLAPMLGKAILASETFACSEEILTIVAMLSLQGSLFYRPVIKEQRQIADNLHKSFLLSCMPGGDALLLLYIYQTWVESNHSAQWCYENYVQFRALNRARAIREQLEALLVRVEVPLLSVQDTPSSTTSMTTTGEAAGRPPLEPSVAIRKALTAGFFYNVARLSRSGDSYKNLKTNQLMHIHPSSCLFRQAGSGLLPPKWILYHELVFTTKEYMRQNIEIQPEWLVEVAPHYYKDKDLK